MSILLGIVVFVVAVAYDYLFATYVKHVAARNAGQAALASGATYLVGLVGLVAVMRGSLAYAPIEAGGLALGTYLGILRGRADD